MENNKKIFKQGVEMIKNIVDDIKVEIANNFTFSDYDMIDNCKALDEYYVAIRNRLRHNFKDVEIMEAITLHANDFLTNEIMYKAKYL